MPGLLTLLSRASSVCVVRFVVFASSPSIVTAAGLNSKPNAPSHFQMPTQDELKKQVGFKAVDDYVQSGMVIGLAAWSKCHPWQSPCSAPAPSQGAPARWLRADRQPRGGPQPLGSQPRPPVLESLTLLRLSVQASAPAGDASHANRANHANHTRHASSASRAVTMHACMHAPPSRAALSCPLPVVLPD